jgi:hypothetical protein
MSRKETTKAGRRPTPGLDAALDRLLAETESPAGVMGPGGLLQQLTGRLMVRRRRRTSRIAAMGPPRRRC